MFLLFAGMALVTYLTRMLPIVVLSKMNLPQWFYRWLSFVPVAVLAALVIPELLLVPSNDSQAPVLLLSASNFKLIASIPTFAVAAKSKNLFLSLVTGMAAILLLNLIFN